MRKDKKKIFLFKFDVEYSKEMHKKHDKLASERCKNYY